MSEKNSVWVVDDDRAIRWVLEKSLEKASINVTCFSDAFELLDMLESERPDAIVSDIRMPSMDGFELLKRIQQKYPALPIIIMTAHSDLDSAVSAFHGGAFEYLPKPFDINEAVAVIERACSFGRSQSLEEKEQTEEPAEPIQEIIGEAPAMQEVFRAIGRLARSHITVLINGESGTGKELVALALHRHSPRVKEPFIALNMAAIPRDLLESELFGHEKGAFTGAQGRRSGRFEQANGGTLFLDEIGDMPAELQTRLLRVLSDGEFYPVGGRTAIKVDVRIIAATHQKLEELVKSGRFREDLFHRLNVIRVHLPALRDRREDIPLLLNYFLERASGELNTETKVLLPEVEKFLSQLDWPGNVRELENSCRWLTVMAAGKDIHMADLPPELMQSSDSGAMAVGENWEAALRKSIECALQRGEPNIAKEIIPACEALLIRAGLNYTGGKRQEAALALGYGRNTLTRKIKELGLEE